MLQHLGTFQLGTPKRATLALNHLVGLEAHTKGRSGSVGSRDLDVDGVSGHTNTPVFPSYVHTTPTHKPSHTPHSPSLASGGLPQP